MVFLFLVVDRQFVSMEATHHHRDTSCPVPWWPTRNGQSICLQSCRAVTRLQYPARPPAHVDRECLLFYATRTEGPCHSTNKKSLENMATLELWPAGSLSRLCLASFHALRALVVHSIVHATQRQRQHAFPLTGTRGPFPWTTRLDSLPMALACCCCCNYTKCQYGELLLLYYI